NYRRTFLAAGITAVLAPFAAAATDQVQAGFNTPGLTNWVLPNNTIDYDRLPMPGTPHVIDNRSRSVLESGICQPRASRRHSDKSFGTREQALLQVVLVHRACQRIVCKCLKNW